MEGIIEVGRLSADVGPSDNLKHPPTAASDDQLASIRRKKGNFYVLRLEESATAQQWYIPAEAVFSYAKKPLKQFNADSIASFLRCPRGMSKSDWKQNVCANLHPNNFVQIILEDQMLLALTFDLEDHPEEQRLLRLWPYWIPDNITRRWRTLCPFELKYPPNERLRRRWDVASFTFNSGRLLKPTPDDLAAWPTVPTDKRVASPLDSLFDVECTICYRTLTAYGRSRWLEDGTMCLREHPVCFTCAGRLVRPIRKGFMHAPGLGFRCPVCRDKTHLDNTEVLTILNGSRKRTHAALDLEPEEEHETDEEESDNGLQGNNDDEIESESESVDYVD